MKYRIVHSYYYYIQKFENEKWDYLYNTYFGWPVFFNSIEQAEKYVENYLKPQIPKVVKEYNFNV